VDTSHAFDARDLGVGLDHWKIREGFTQIKEEAMENRVLFLHLEFKYEIEQALRDVGRIISAIRRGIHKGMHGRHSIAILIVTEETTDQFSERMLPVLGDLSSLENFWCYVAPQADDIVGRYGHMDPLCHRVRKAWIDARQRSKPKHMRYSQRR
jgi:hypothetical protein